MKTKAPTNLIALAGIAVEVRYVHVSAEDAGRQTTVAYYFDDSTQQVVYNYAECSHNDQYVKATGRIKAKGRLEGNSKSHPNQYIPYSAVSDDGNSPKYGLIAAEIYSRICFPL